MNKDKLSYYASYVAIFCGIFLFVMKIYTPEKSFTTTFMGFLFIGIGIVGLRKFRGK
ncbi:MAG: hypothetical protein U5M51_12280 [Emticicia sp.]|nr:hypothetical protein [Emticicia sp.]